jgi:hypothetical protein
LLGGLSKLKGRSARALQNPAAAIGERIEAVLEYWQNFPDEAQASGTSFIKLGNQRWGLFDEERDL